VNHSLRISAAAAVVAISAHASVGVAADANDLAAPIYPGAVPAVVADGAQVDPFYVGTFGGARALDCSALTESRGFGGELISAQQAQAEGRVPGPWCFLTTDSIDKVKAYYDQSVGAMQGMQGENGVQGYVVFAERAWYPGDGESLPGFGHSSVSIAALPPPRVMGDGRGSATPAEGFPGMEANLFYTESRFFGPFVDGVDWFGDPTKRNRSELDAVYRQYNHLESAFFQRRAPSFETADVVLRKQADAQRAQRQQAAAMAPVAGLMQLGAAAAGNNDAAPTAEEDAQFNRAMAADPALQQRYVALTQQVSTLMMQGNFDAADALLDEIDELEASNPELAALNNQQQARQQSVGAAAQAREAAVINAGNSQMDAAIWGTAVGFIEALDKEDYYTLIVIDNKLTGYERDYSRDRAAIDAETSGLVENVDLGSWGVRLEYRGPDAYGGSPATTEQPAVDEEKKEGLEDRARQGIRALRRLF
jgi:hypothetical protein